MKRRYGVTMILLASALSISVYLFLIPEKSSVDHQVPAPLSLEELSEIRDQDQAEELWSRRIELAVDEESRLQAISTACKHQSFAAAPALDKVVGDPKASLTERLLAAESLSRIARHGDFPGLEKGLQSRVPELRLACSEALARSGHADLGIQSLFNHVLLKSTRQQALLRLQRLTEQRFPVDLKAGPVKSNKQLALWKTWWKNNKGNFSPPSYN